MTAETTINPINPAERTTATSLVTRLAEVMGDLPDIQPGGRNDYFKYSYISDKQVLGALRPRLAKAHIMIFPDVETEEMIARANARGGESYLTKLTVLFRVIDGETGEMLSGHGIGYGDDSGDKGSNKAFTAALKNWLIKLFLIGGDADIEDDRRTDEDAAARASGRDDRTIVSITPSSAPTPEKGGRSRNPTELQLMEISRLSVQLKLGVGGIVELVNDTLGETLVIMADDPNPRGTLTAFLTELDPEDIGRLITAMRNLLDEE